MLLLFFKSDENKTLAFREFREIEYVYSKVKHTFLVKHSFRLENSQNVEFRTEVAGEEPTTTVGCTGRLIQCKTANLNRLIALESILRFQAVPATFIDLRPFESFHTQCTVKHSLLKCGLFPSKIHT